MLFRQNQKMFFSTFTNMRNPKPNMLKNIKNKIGNILME